MVSDPISGTPDYSITRSLLWAPDTGEPDTAEESHNNTRNYVTQSIQIDAKTS